MSWLDAPGRIEVDLSMNTKEKEAKQRLIVALDVDSLDEAEALIDELQDVVGFFKVGMQLYYSAGPGIIDLIHDRGSKIFLDLKLLDIPNTVAHAARALTRHEVDILNLHASGGKEMMSRAAETVKDEALKLGIVPPLVIGVTVLTSITQEVLNHEVGIAGSPQETVVRWAKSCLESGLDGVVASALEAKAIKETLDCPVIITPGIRPAGSALEDQKRVLTPQEAISRGATHLVVGRPITKASTPRDAAVSILEEISAGIL